jgi:hypothetical protein
VALSNLFHFALATLPVLSSNYGDGNLADTNNNNLGNTPAERQRNQKLVNSNNQDYAKIDKSKGEDFLFT